MKFQTATGPSTVDRDARRPTTSVLRPVPSVGALLAFVLLVVVPTAGVIAAVTSEHSPATTAVRQRSDHQGGLSLLPAGARGVVSAALGTGNPAYSVRASGPGLLAARNAAQDVQMRFSSSGVLIRSGRAEMGLSLRAVGYGGALRAVGPVQPLACGNRVIYRRRGLTEWYANGPLGLEQGFTVAGPPRARQSRTLTIAIGVAGHVRAALKPRTQTIALAAPGASTLRYGDLIATDARGRRLHATLALRPHNTLALVVHVASGAVYPLHVDPLIEQRHLESKEETFGASVAMSADGTTVLIGAPYANGGIGAAWIFTRNNETWTNTAAFNVASEEEGKAYFGRSVALDEHGNIALVGGDGNNEFNGAVWSFYLSGGSWKREKITVSNEIEAADFGASVALSGGGAVALVGGSDDNRAAGAVWVFERSAHWVETTKLTTTNEISGRTGLGGFFGEHVALSADGSTALIGAGWDNSRKGAAWIFTGSGSAWTEKAKLEPEGEEGEGFFGSSVALDEHGQVAVVGADDNDQNRGAAWIFTHGSVSWLQQEVTGAGESSEGIFGAAVAIAAKSDSVLIGGKAAAWLFAKTGMHTWSEQERLGEVGTDVAYTGFVALSADANEVAVGGEDAASIFVMGLPPEVITGTAANVEATAAVLEGTVNPNGFPTHAHFEYGPTALYGSVTPSESLGPSATAVAFHAAIASLAPGTQYHYRLVAQSVAGLSYGDDEALTTAPPTQNGGGSGGPSGSGGSASSGGPTGAVLAPASSSAPVLSGSAIVGRTVAVSPGSWANGPTSFAYQWQRCASSGGSCASIAGAGGASYTVARDALGRRLRAVVTATNTAGSVAAISDASALVGGVMESSMSWKFDWTRKFTVVESLVAQGVVPGATVEVLCHGSGCPFVHAHTAGASRHTHCRGKRRCRAQHPPRSSAEVDLAALFKGRRLGVGTQITVSVIEQSWVGKAFLFTTRAGRIPSEHSACVAPGSSQPGVGC